MKNILSLILSILILFSFVSCVSNKKTLNDDLLVNKNDNIVDDKNTDDENVANNENISSNDDTVKVELNTSEINKEADSKWICENKVLLIELGDFILPPPDGIDYDSYISHKFVYIDENADKNKTVSYYGKTLNLSYEESYMFFPFIDTDRYTLSDKNDPDYNIGGSLYYLKDGTFFGGTFPVEFEDLHDGMEKEELVEWAQNKFADKVDFSKYYLYDYDENESIGLTKLRWTYDIGEFPLVPQFVLTFNLSKGILSAVYYNTLFSFNEEDIELPSKEKVDNLILDSYTSKWIDRSSASDKTVTDILYWLTEYEGKPMLVANLYETYTNENGNTYEDKIRVAIPFIKANNNELDN